MTEEESRIDYLIANDMDVNEKYLDHPHLINMCIEGNIEYVEKLIKNGADINYETKDGWTALTYAIDRDYAKLAELLLQNGADINYETKNGWTPLMFAIFSKKANLVELLLQNGADVNYANKENEIEGIITPFLIAIRFNAKLVELLIQNGADVNYETEDGDRPLEFARKIGNAKIVFLLKKYANGNGKRKFISKKPAFSAVSPQTNSSPTYLQTPCTFNAAWQAFQK